MAHHETLISIARRLRAAPERFAAAGAVQDPSLLMLAQAAGRRRREQPAGRQRRPIGREMAAALLLVVAVAVALAWCNSPWRATHDAFRHAPVALTVGPWTLGADLRSWIDESLMTLFFLVVGLEAKRERDLGELRGAALSTGVGFTVSVLIASRAFDGALLDQAKVGILATALLAPVLAVAALAALRRHAAFVRRAPVSSPCAA